MVAVDGTSFPVTNLDGHGRVVYQAHIAPRVALVGHLVSVDGAAD